MASVSRPRNILLEHNGDAGTSHEDSNSDITAHFINIAYHSTILSSFHAYRSLLDMVLRMQVNLSIR